MYLFQKKLSAAFAAFVCLIFILSACKSVDPEKEKLAKELEKAEKERRDQWFLDADGKKIAPERDMVEEMLKSSPFTAVPYIFEIVIFVLLFELALIVFLNYPFPVFPFR